MRFQSVFVLLFFFALTSCKKDSAGGNSGGITPPANNGAGSYTGTATQPLPLSTEAQNLLANLKLHASGSIATHKIFFGHQDANAYGINADGTKWTAWGASPKTDYSDDKVVTGSHPALYGFDIGSIEIGSSSNVDGVPFSLMETQIKEAYARKGIITISWHSKNPVTGGEPKDNGAGTIGKLLPGGTANATFVTYLNRVSDFLDKLKDGSGKRIPVIFRPFHENTIGTNGFWWGANGGSAAEYKSLWQYTADYLKLTKGLTNLILAYSPWGGTTLTEITYTASYPGNFYVDITGLDYYADTGNTTTFPNLLRANLDIVKKIATANNKLMAVTETGYNGIPNHTWWTQVLQPVLLDYQNLAYVMVWRNAGLTHYFAPYPGNGSATDFVSFYNHSQIYFQSETTSLNLYAP